MSPVPSLLRAASRVLLSLGLVGLAACGYPKEEGEKLANQTYALSTQLQALQKAMRDQQQLGERHAEQIDAMSAEVESLSKAARRNDADLGVQVENVLTKLAEMRGLVESNKERVDTIEAEIEQLQEKAKVASAESEEDKRLAVEAAKAREALFANPNGLVAEATRLINAQKLDEARSLLREFLLRSKSDSKVDAKKAEAQFLIADTFFVEGDYKRAATEYNSVRKRYASSPLVPDALLKMGMCFEKLALVDDAKLFYRTLTKQFPKSDAAKKATERLKALRG